MQPPENRKLMDMVVSHPDLNLVELQKNFVFKELIGSGAYANVYKAREKKTHEWCAIKVHHPHTQKIIPTQILKSKKLS